MAWEIIDHTNGKNSGYLRLMKDGRRVADFFPYARSVSNGDEELWVREQAEYIASALNAAQDRL